MGIISVFLWEPEVLEDTKEGDIWSDKVSAAAAMEERFKKARRVRFRLIRFFG